VVIVTSSKVKNKISIFLERENKNLKLTCSMLRSAAFPKLTRSAIQCKIFTETPPPSPIPNRTTGHHKQQLQPLLLLCTTIHLHIKATKTSLSLSKNLNPLFFLSKTQRNVEKLLFFGKIKTSETLLMIPSQTQLMKLTWIGEKGRWG